MSTMPKPSATFASAWSFPSDISQLEEHGTAVILVFCLMTLGSYSQAASPHALVLQLNSMPAATMAA